MSRRGHLYTRSTFGSGRQSSPRQIRSLLPLSDMWANNPCPRRQIANPRRMHSGSERPRQADTNNALFVCEMAMQDREWDGDSHRRHACTARVGGPRPVQSQAMPNEPVGDQRRTTRRATCVQCMYMYEYDGKETLALVPSTGRRACVTSCRERSRTGLVDRFACLASGHLSASVTSMANLAS